MPTSLNRQRGVFAIVAALSLVVFMTVAGLVLDLGRLFIAKAELQGAADGCALSAAREMDGQSDSLTRAVNAGVQVAVRNSVDLQHVAANVTSSDVTFSGSISGPFVTAASANPGSVKYVKCTPKAVSADMWFMKVVGVNTSNVGAEAIARLASSQATCATPVGLCTAQTSKSSPAPNWGLETGKWYGGLFTPGSGMTGNFNWVDFTPPNGGANELKDLIAGSGSCKVPVTGSVGQSGYNAGLVDAWNTRFGIYKGSYSVAENRPDWTGFAYTDTSWSAKRGAYSDFKVQRVALARYQGDGATGLSTGNNAQIATSAQHGTYGADRRMAIVPVLRCADWQSNQTVQMRDWACVLLLNPIGTPSDVKMEYLGLTSEPGSPCATTGIAGGSNTNGPAVPTLVQ
jgi:Flp pilus assembly protein TadG